VNLISKLQKLKFYRIQLSKKHFTSYQRKDGQAEVKLLRKYVVCRCPDMEAADSLRDALNYALTSRADSIDEYMRSLECNIEQTNLFVELGVKNQPEAAAAGRQADVSCAALSEILEAEK